MLYLLSVEIYFINLYFTLNLINLQETFFLNSSKLREKELQRKLTLTEDWILLTCDFFFCFRTGEKTLH